MTEYENLVNSAPAVLVEFYATWCPHCQRMMPIVADIRELLGDTLPIYQLDIDKNNEVAEEAGANSVPTFVIYRGGQPVWRHSGEMDGNTLLQKLQQFNS
ncbi:MAG: thioredoxin family protein [Muribaculaceae bacterium]|nr:thioredoxin family protein [Muribaculaceae bacterium]